MIDTTELACAAVSLESASGIPAAGGLMPRQIAGSAALRQCVWSRAGQPTLAARAPQLQRVAALPLGDPTVEPCLRFMCFLSLAEQEGVMSRIMFGSCSGLSNAFLLGTVQHAVSLHVQRRFSLQNEYECALR